MRIVAENEVIKRETAVQEITYRAEALRNYFDKLTLDEECKRRFYI